MNEPAIKLTTYFSERDRAAGAFLADALTDVYERHEIRASVLLRGSAGFGDRRAVRSERSLTLSESLPAVSVAVDANQRIESALPDVLALAEHGLVSLERTQLLSAERLDSFELPGEPRTAAKLTIYGGRGLRAGGEAGYVSALDTLRAAGVTGACVLLAVDGTVHGERRRARFLARNAGVPLMLLAVGDPRSVRVALPAVWALVEQPVGTIERVQVCRSAGRALDEPVAVAQTDPSGLPIWQKLMVHAEEQAKHDGRPLHSELIRQLRNAGGTGATVLRGVRGFYGDRGPFADRMLTIKRHAPTITVIVDTPANISRLWPVVELLTRQAGLVTSELVPAFHREPRGNRRALGARLAAIPPTVWS